MECFLERKEEAIQRMLDIVACMERKEIKTKFRQSWFLCGVLAVILVQAQSL